MEFEVIINGKEDLRMLSCSAKTEVVLRLGAQPSFLTELCAPGWVI